MRAMVPGERRNAVLRAAADALEENKSKILNANQRDCDKSIRDVAEGRMSRPLFERLRINEQGIAQMASGVREVATLADPIGRRLAVTDLDDGLTLYKESISPYICHNLT